MPWDKTRMTRSLAGEGRQTPTRKRSKHSGGLTTVRYPERNQATEQQSATIWSSIKTLMKKLAVESESGGK